MTASYLWAALAVWVVLMVGIVAFFWAFGDQRREFDPPEPSPQERRNERRRAIHAEAKRRQTTPKRIAKERRRLHDGARMADQDDWRLANPAVGDRVDPDYCADVIDLDDWPRRRRLWQRQQDDIAWAKSVHPSSFEPPIDFAAHVNRTLPDQKDDIA